MRLVVANGTALEVDDQGPAGAEPVLLVMGLGMQLVAWPDELVQRLLAQGHRVIRFDNRDAGLSQGFDGLGKPNLAAAGVRHLLHLPVKPPYTLADMADDTLGLIDALHLPRVHLVGASMGGMIAQHLAARHPQRVASLALLMTTSGARHLPQPGWDIRALLLQRPDGRDVEAVVAHLERVMRAIGSPGFPPEPQALRDRLRATVARAWRPAGTARQLAAVVADGDRRALLPRIQAPTVVIHGEADPLVPVQAGHELARLIAGAEADFIPGMGHDLPQPLLARLADRIVANARRASAERPPA
ncbi:MAG: alpha/beta fold hydrolase [Betaproteobacteria bacterium]|jgi:pimeloyl-ACP methyl ester carboxylesterase|nr:alpha/beta fold hydrolase [Burkholderiaceae bacterium]MCZ8110059.1 alpha/beta hydrolase [Rubrivivax sp.]MCZ8176510.1 alpha/beta hydrolase [Burkholderiaceae bacterium]